MQSVENSEIDYECWLYLWVNAMCVSSLICCGTGQSESSNGL